MSKYYNEDKNVIINLKLLPCDARCADSVHACMCVAPPQVPHNAKKH